jgi:Domain of unknown function (DUF6438)
LIVFVAHTRQSSNSTIQQSYKNQAMKLQLLLALSLLAVVVLVACNRKAAAAPSTSETPKPSGTTKPVEEVPREKAYQVVGFQKTACFGKCPVFQVKFYNDGKVTWYGQHNVERMGWFDAMVGKDVLADIRAKVSEAKYWDFAPAYPIAHKIADLPSTVTYIRIGDMEKSVINTHQAPVELVAFEDYLEGIINGLAWKPTRKD